MKSFSVLCCILVTSILFGACGENLTNGAFYSDGALSTERYNHYDENPFVDALLTPTSTFSIDADGGSYANVRRMIESGEKPVNDAIRIEEFINYFQYNYAEPTGEHPIGVNGEVATCPWNTEHRLIRIGIKGKTIPNTQLPPSNIVLLVDVSGSMGDANKLPLLQRVFPLLVDRFGPNDRIAVVTYAGADRVALPATRGSEKDKINSVLKNLNSGGGTAGAKGINTAYEIAQENFIKGGNNRVILATDGDFNIGVSSTKGLVDLITEKRKLGIYLTVVGVGTGNYNEASMEQLADNGNGTYEYIDNYEQGKKVFSDEYNKFYTVARDVKVQVVFNTTYVKSYRLIGYENRLLDSAEFKNDSTDAGEISSGQSITALYEIVPNFKSLGDQVPLFSIDFRYKTPDNDAGKQMELQIMDKGSAFEGASEDFRFAACVAAFGLILRESAYKGTVTYDSVAQWAQAAHGYDPLALRSGFITLVNKAKTLR